VSHRAPVSTAVNNQWLARFQRYYCPVCHAFS